MDSEPTFAELTSAYVKARAAVANAEAEVTLRRTELERAQAERDRLANASVTSHRAFTDHIAELVEAEAAI